jgi:hypothetical protein
VVFVTGGRCSADFFIAKGKRNLYILGDRSRARCSSADASTSTTSRLAISRTSRARRHDHQRGSKFPTDLPVNVLHHADLSTTRRATRNGISAPDYEGNSGHGIAKHRRRTGSGIFTARRWAAPSNLRHQVYVHGRPAGYLIVNDIRRRRARLQHPEVDEYYNIVRNSRLSALQDPTSRASAARGQARSTSRVRRRDGHLQQR